MLKRQLGGSSPEESNVRLRIESNDGSSKLLIYTKAYQQAQNLKDFKVKNLKTDSLETLKTDFSNKSVKAQRPEKTEDLVT